MVILDNFFVGALALTIFYSVGGVLRRSLFKGLFLADPLIIDIFLGAVSLTFFYAILKTSGVTILLGFVPVVLIGIIFSKRSKAVEHHFESDIRMIDVIICFLISFGYYNYVFHPGFDGGYATEDLSFYSIIAENLRELGNETKNFYASFPSSIQNNHSFYHYFELWQAAAIAELFSLTEYNALSGVVFPIAATVLFLSVLSLMKHLKLNGVLLYLSIIVFLFTNSLADLFKIIFPEKTVHVTGIFHDFSFKMIWIYLTLFVWLIEEIKGNERGILFGFLLIFIYPTSCFVILPGFVVLAACKYWKKSPNINQLIWFISCSSLFLILLYSIQPTIHIQIYKPSIKTYLFKRLPIFLTDFNEIKRSFGNCLEYLLYWVSSFSVALFFLFFLKDKKGFFNSLFSFIWRDINVVILAGSIFSFFLWLVIFELKDSSQVLTNILLPFLNIGIFLFFVKLISSPIKRNIYLGIFFAGLQFSTFLIYHINRLSVFEMKYINNKLYTLNVSKSVYFTSSNDYVHYMDRNPEYRIPSPELRRYSSGYSPICMTLDVIPKSNDFAEAYYSDYMIKITPYSTFCRTNGLDVALWKNQLIFIKKHRIKFIFFSKSFDKIDFFKEKLNLKYVCSDSKGKFDLYAKK